MCSSLLKILDPPKGAPVRVQVQVIVNGSGKYLGLLKGQENLRCVLSRTFDSNPYPGIPDPKLGDINLVPHQHDQEDVEQELMGRLYEVNFLGLDFIRVVCGRNFIGYYRKDDHSKQFNDFVAKLKSAGYTEVPE
jgi:hypothetical protein